jgi:hypothetical protein
MCLIRDIKYGVGSYSVYLFNQSHSIKLTLSFLLCNCQIVQIQLCICQNIKQDYHKKYGKTKSTIFLYLGKNIKSILTSLTSLSQSSSIIYRSSIRIGSGLQTFIPNTCLLSFKLRQNDTLSLHVTDTSSLYEMRIGNVFGIQEVSNDVSV